MNGNLGEVFNTYNVNILFTVAALPAKVNMIGGPPGMAPMIQPPSNNNANLIIPGNSGNRTPVVEPKVNVIPPTNQKQITSGQAPNVGKKFGEDDDSKKHLVCSIFILTTKLE